MLLTLDKLISKNIKTIDDVCNSIRDHVVENIKGTKVTAMTCDLVRSTYCERTQYVWEGVIVFRVEDNSQDVVNEIAAMLNGVFTLTEPNTHDPYHWRLPNAVYDALLGSTPPNQYEGFVPIKTVRFHIAVAETAFSKSTTSDAFFETENYTESGAAYNEWKWVPEEIAEYDSTHFGAMCRLFLNVTPGENLVL